MKDYLTLSEKLYCVLQDTKDYNHNRLDPEIDWIIEQLEIIKEQFDKEYN